MTAWKAAIDAVAERARRARSDATDRWAASVPGLDTLDPWSARVLSAGRVTVNFHPDRVARGGRTVAEGLATDGVYRSQWVTGISAGSRSAVHGGERQRFEHELFAGAYDQVDPAAGIHPIYGAFDLLCDDHGGSPRFGSTFLVLRPHVRERTTLCVGDSHRGPSDVGTFATPWSILAGVAEQAAHGALLDRDLDVEDLRRALAGARPPTGASRELDGYVEAQVHGGVTLADDVEAIVVDPSFRGTRVEEHLSTAAERCGFELAWHCGSELHVDRVPDDFRGEEMPALARRVAGSGGVVDARAIGLAAAREPFQESGPSGDAPGSTPQQLKYLWHTVLRHGTDAPGAGRT